MVDAAAVRKAERGVRVGEKGYGMRTDLRRLRKSLREGGRGVDGGGMWHIPHPGVRGLTFCVIASWECGWDHVSVSTPNRCPTWEEMCWIKGLFFEPEEAVVQYHPPASVYVNNHPYCLPLWRPHDHEIILPPTWMVGTNPKNYVVEPHRG